MSYLRFYPQWYDWPDVSTPITAAAMQHIEDGLASAAGGGITGPASSTVGDFATFVDTAGNIQDPGWSLDTDTTLAANSNTRIPSQAAVKAYADKLTASGLTYKGTQDCSLNPNYPAGSVGDLYVVSVAGKIGGASGTSVSVGDQFMCETANAGGTQAAVGADWNVVHSNTGGTVTGPATSTVGDFAQFNSTGGTVLEDTGLSLSTDGTLSSASDSLIASQKAVKTYVDVVSFNNQTGTAYTLVLSDRGKVITMSNASANTLTIPTNANVAFPLGSQVIVRQAGAGTTTIAGATGVSVVNPYSSFNLYAQNAQVTLLKIGTDSWSVNGEVA